MNGEEDIVEEEPNTSYKYMIIWHTCDSHQGRRQGAVMWRQENLIWIKQLIWIIQLLGDYNNKRDVRYRKDYT